MVAKLSCARGGTDRNWNVQWFSQDCLGRRARCYVIRAALTRAKLEHAKISTVVMGNVIQAGNKMNPARQAAIHGGLPVEVPAMTVNRVCGSGAQAIASAAQEIMLGYG